jgi:hypothetical protein
LQACLTADDCDNSEAETAESHESAQEKTDPEPAKQNVAPLRGGIRVDLDHKILEATPEARQVEKLSGSRMSIEGRQAFVHGRQFFEDPMAEIRRLETLPAPLEDWLGKPATKGPPE